MNVLIIGGGGREHAITWKLSQSSNVNKIFCAPGNPGMAQIAENIDIDVNNLAELNVSAILTIFGGNIP